MAFKKFRETIAAFTTPRREPTLQEQIDAYGQSLKESCSGKRTVQAMRFGVYVVVLIPTAMLVSSILHQFTHATSQTVGTVGVIIGFVTGWAVQQAHIDIMTWIPFYKLNPFFGSKIEEVILSFRTPTKKPS